jgi:hypothetical protein
MHFGDMDIDGYPDIMFTCTGNNLNRLYLYQNFMNQNNTFSHFYLYQDAIDKLVSKNLNITKASFLDVL